MRRRVHFLTPYTLAAGLACSLLSGCPGFSPVIGACVLLRNMKQDAGASPAQRAAAVDRDPCFQAMIREPRRMVWQVLSFLMAQAGLTGVLAYFDRATRGIRAVLGATAMVMVAGSFVGTLFGIGLYAWIRLRRA